MEEQRLPGGNLSDTSRLGDTIRRNAGPWTPTVHALLRHLDERGFGAAPRPLGIDGGREILAFIEGDTQLGWPEPFADWVFSEDCLVQSARLMRQYHDLTAAFVAPPDATWRLSAPTAHEVICHNDWAPYNAIFRDRRVIAIVDWDMTGPGSRVWDLVWMAYVWVPIASGHKRFPLPERAQRLRVLCDAYGLESRDDVMPTLITQLRFWADFAEAQARAGHPGFSKLAGWGLPAAQRATAQRLEGERDVFEHALTG